MARPVSVQTEDHVAVVTLQNAQALNSFDPETLRTLHGLFGDLLADADVHGLILTGSGKAFSAGADVGEMKARADAGDISAFILEATEHLHPMLRDLHESSKPFVAAVNGVAAGGGLGLALAADARIGCPEARFAAGYFGIGASPDGGATWFMPRLVGTQRTRRFFMDNMVLGADEALDWGLVDEVVPSDQLMGRAREVAARWASWSPHSILATKRLLAHQGTSSLQAQLDLERGLIAAAGATTAFQEGVTAFQEKRTPRFR